jgi:hypothetical protein
MSAFEFHMVCEQCARLLRVKEICCIGLLRPAPWPCAACAAPLHAGANGFINDYTPVTGEQLAEIKAARELR